MIIRLAIIWLLVAGFAAGFAELVTSDTVGRADRAGSPCDEWSNPDCSGPAAAGAPLN
ncbi:MAG: hypothetical protein ACT6QU_16220 [Aliihoeflea sp.]|jgi:hypothetical protein|uniref:hypothetical protein n=1 Tax=Aliihoeflea sp. TaxID=2608088 RepID=UPI004033D13C